MKRLVVLAVSGLLLAGCASVHPGDAAVVDGTSISMDQLDRTAAAYCTVTAQSQQEVAAVDNASIRRQAITNLVLEKVAADLIDDRGLKVDRAVADLTPEQLAQITSQFGDESSDAVQALIDSRRLYASFVAIGADSTGQVVTDDTIDALATAGQEVVTGAVADHDVSFAPRLGLSSDGLPTGGIGSLSVDPTGSQTAPGDLPAALRCSA